MKRKIMSIYEKQLLNKAIRKAIIKTLWIDEGMCHM